MMQVAWTEVPQALGDLFYALDPLVSGILLTNMLQWVYRKAVATRSGTHWQVYGPVYLVAVANLCCMMLPLATLFIYVGKIGYPGSKMWKGSWFPNTPHGVFFYMMKFVGTGCLMVGVMQVTGLATKIASKWRRLRNGRHGVAAAPETEASKQESVTAIVDVQKGQPDGC